MVDIKMFIVGLILFLMLPFGVWCLDIIGVQKETWGLTITILVLLASYFMGLFIMSISMSISPDDSDWKKKYHKLLEENERI